MDPDALLRDLREHVRVVLDEVDSSHATDLAEKIQNLDNWLSNGGFLPQDWAR